MAIESIKVGVTAVIRDGGRVLLGFKCRAFDSEFMHKWVTPGGRINPGESAEAAITREVMEETGLHVSLCAKLPSQELIHEKGHFVFLVYEARPIGGNLIARDDLSEVKWFNDDELVAVRSRMTPLTRCVLDDSWRARAQTEWDLRNAK